ncbi:MAG: glycosyltransferase family protein [Candidatus Omnitrophota bacterium]
MILAIVQARMASTRLPGKVMKEVLNKPLIQYLLERLSLSTRIDKIILATSLNKENDLLSAFVDKLGFNVFRGSENDVLDRFYLAAKEYCPKSIVRVTGDCPLIDAGICDDLINFYEKENADHAHLSLDFAEGLDCEIFSFSALEMSCQNAKLKSEREHVTPYIKNHPEIFKLKFLNNKRDDSFYRITVDNEEDFDVVKAIMEHFSKNPAVRWPEIKDFLNLHHDIMAINSHIERNEGFRISLEQDEEVEKYDA